MATNKCILRISRTWDGALSGDASASPYTCEALSVTQHTESFPTKIAWRITSPTECNESADVLPIAGCLLEAQGNTIRRADGFAYFTGDFTLSRKVRGVKTTYFSGTLELIFQSGSHEALGEKCYEPAHVEGWLTGRGLGPAKNYRLNAAVTGKGELSKSRAKYHAVFAEVKFNRLTGTLVK